MFYLPLKSIFISLSCNLKQSWPRNSSYLTQTFRASQVGNLGPVSLSPRQSPNHPSVILIARPRTWEHKQQEVKTKIVTMASLHPYQKLDIDERVKRVLLKTPLIDGHNDLPQQPRAIFHGQIHNNPKFDLEKGFQRGMTDIPRLREGGCVAIFIHIDHILNYVCRCCRRSILVCLRSLSEVCREFLNA
jgi:hypothetical protein